MSRCYLRGDMRQEVCDQMKFEPSLRKWLCPACFRDFKKEPGVLLDRPVGRKNA